MTTTLSKPRARTSHPPRRRSPTASDAVTRAAPHTTEPRAQSTHMARSEAQPRTVRRNASDARQAEALRHRAPHTTEAGRKAPTAKARGASSNQSTRCTTPTRRSGASTITKGRGATQATAQHSESHDRRKKKGGGGAGQWEAGRSTRRGRRRRVRLTGRVKARSPHSTKAEVRPLGKAR